MKSSDEIANLIAQAQTAVAFTGAGLSTESGIADFRSPGGVWSRYQPVLYDDFLARAEARHEYWRQKCEIHGEFESARPNRGHKFLSAWEAAGRITAVVTQNIDGLHQQAGSQSVIELHGTARKVVCLDCGAEYNVDKMTRHFRERDEVPPCTACANGRLKHATVSFGQALPQAVLEQATLLCRAADLVFVLGSSLVVEPAASLPRIAQAHGARLIIVNREPTPLDNIADVVLRAPLGETLAAVDRRLAGDP